MTEQDAQDAEWLDRHNRTLQRKLERAESKLRAMETLQQQNSNLMRALMAELDEERAESERLLLNILPEPVAKRLKTEPGIIADRFESVSVLFLDIVGFTPLSEAMTAQHMVTWLNDVYSVFDEMTAQGEVEKIRTIGDGYMVAAGVPYPNDEHALDITNLALGMKAHFSELPLIEDRRVEFRIGISSGPVVGGVIGTHKFQYDIWGDTVNTAARMESHGVPGRIHISPTTHALVKDSFVCESRGMVEIKGKGELETWFVEGPLTRPK